MVTVLAPLGYVAFLVGSLLIFSKVYRKRQAKRAHREPWFGTHHTRNIYVSLLSLDPPPPRKVLVAALIRRAMTDIQRVMEIREAKAALQNLLQKGQIGDDTWSHILETEKEMDSELYEVVQEANHFRPGWGQYIFPHAGDMLQHEKNKKQFEDIEQEKARLSKLYGENAPLLTPAPIMGLVGGKRELPSSTPANALVPGGSKPGTPQPPNPQMMAQMQALRQAQMLQAQQQLAQQQQSQGQQSNGSAPSTPSKPGSATSSGRQTPAATNGATSSAKQSPLAKVAAVNGSSPAAAAKLGSPMMQRQASTADSVASSTLTGDSSDDDEGDDAGSNAGSSSQPGSSKPSPGGGPKKTPKKKNKKKGKKK